MTVNNDPAPAPTLDLNAYFNRIGYADPREVSLSALNGIIATQVQSIPFENLDVLLGRGIALDVQSLEQKLVHDRRGGYCFELNGLLLLALQALGFAVRPISARVRWQNPRSFTPPRTHLFLRIEIAGVDWLADVGVGGVSPTAAIRLELDTEQATPHEPRRLLQADGIYFHQVKLAGVWTDVCEFTLEEMPPIDRELANWFTSTHPQSHFKHRLLVARAAPDGDGRLTLLNSEFTIRAATGHAHKRTLTSAPELLDVLAEHFGLHFAPGTRFGSPGSPWPM